MLSCQGQHPTQDALSGRRQYSCFVLRALSHSVPHTYCHSLVPKHLRCAVHHSRAFESAWSRTCVSSRLSDADAGGAEECLSVYPDARSNARSQGRVRHCMRCVQTKQLQAVT